MISFVNIVSNRQAYLDSTAKPLACGRLEIYETESSTSYAQVYSDAELSIPLANPVILDVAGRAPALYAAAAAYVKVERYAGKNQMGESLYELVYDYETPPGIDISSYWNVNFVETYDQLRTQAPKTPTFVTGEGNPHLYVWNPSRPSQGLNEITDISSQTDSSGSWRWETKRVYADQCGIRNDGRSYPASNWLAFADLSMEGYETAIPKGYYAFGGSALQEKAFKHLEIDPNVSFTNMNGNWSISVSTYVRCESQGLPIRWTLPTDRAYDTRFFNKIKQNPAGTTNEGGVDLIVNSDSFDCDRINRAFLFYKNSKNTNSNCMIKEIIAIDQYRAAQLKLEFAGTCEKAHSANLHAANLYNVKWLLVNTNISFENNLHIPRLSVLPSGLISGNGYLTAGLLSECAPGGIGCPFRISGTENNLDPNIFNEYGLRWQLRNNADWKAHGIKKYGSPISYFSAKDGQAFSSCDFSQITVTVEDGIEVSFVNCKIGTLEFYGSPIITCIGCKIDFVKPMSTSGKHDLSKIKIMKTEVGQVVYPSWTDISYALSDGIPVLVEGRTSLTNIVFHPVPLSDSNYIDSGRFFKIGTQHKIKPLGFSHRNANPNKEFHMHIPNYSTLFFDDILTFPGNVRANNLKSPTFLYDIEIFYMPLYSPENQFLYKLRTFNEYSSSETHVDSSRWPSDEGVITLAFPEECSWGGN